MTASISRQLTAGAVAVAIGLVAPQVASAQGNTIPPGNSAISQYLESIPTAKGSQPSTGIHWKHGSHSSGTRPGGGGAGGAGGGAGGSNGGGGVPSSTDRALAAKGPAGAADAAFASSTAPTSATGGKGQKQTPSGGSVSPAASVLKSLTGSSNGGGLGPLLPIILAAALLAGTTLALKRRHRSDS